MGDDGTLTASGKFPAGNIPAGTPFAVGRVSAELKNVPAPARYKPGAVLSQHLRHELVNEFDFEGVHCVRDSPSVSLGSPW